MNPFSSTIQWSRMIQYNYLMLLGILELSGEFDAVTMDPKIINGEYYYNTDM